MTRILVADDDPDLCSFLKEMLSQQGCMVTTVSNGADAVATAVEESFDLVILNMMMPGLDGIRVTQVLRKISPRLPIIGLTDYAGRGLMMQASEIGIVCLNKPLVINDLHNEINNTLLSRR